MDRTILDEAKKIEEEIIENRRKIHSFAELGFELPKTVEFVCEKLKSYGIEPSIIGKSGITFTLGEGEKTFLLRADMDALPMEETTGLSFSAKNGNTHSCGHDIHTASLLGAARILKDRESELKGKVKFMFQPAEELLAGANDMVEAGILENPKVDAAFAIHIIAGLENSKAGVVYHKPRELTFSGDALTIRVVGKDAHGSTPHLGVDAVYVASNIAIALKSLSNHVVPTDVPSVVLVGKITGGTAPNTVAGEVEMEVSVRSKNREYREVLLDKVKEVSTNIAKAYGATAIIIHNYGMPGLYNDEKLDYELSNIIKELLGEDKVQDLTAFNGSEDFTMIAEKVPSTLMNIGLGSIDEGYPYYLHHPSLLVDEKSIYKVAAVYAYSSLRWLENFSN
ncbi:M20 metallopeptidase family protein [Miniphocaeibacter massiliensis]|uniref:M20 metallopeptidase family protein n=1 Tax=Miniphocaeibacter massiliensis TaxID=2041841 RepID=UPI000C1C7CE4|nr:M20 family metallopeptidase [Miniphocaeibacter massiliensis]